MANYKIAQCYILYFLLGIVYFPRTLVALENKTNFAPTVSVCQLREIMAHPVGRISSPWYPRVCTEKNLHCELVLKIPPLKQIKMELNELSIIASPNCTKDAISVTDNQWSKNKARETTYCGWYSVRSFDRSVTTVVRTFPKRPNYTDVVVRFITKENTTGAGFLLRYNLIDRPTTSNPTTLKYPNMKNQNVKAIAMLAGVSVSLSIVLVVLLVIWRYKRRCKDSKPSISVRIELENESTKGTMQNIQEGATTVTGTHQLVIGQESTDAIPAPAKIVPYKVIKIPSNTETSTEFTELNINIQEGSLNGSSLDEIHHQKFLKRESGYVIPAESNRNVPCEEAQSTTPFGYTELDVNTRHDPLKGETADRGYQKLLKPES